MQRKKVGNIGTLVLAGIAAIASGCARDIQEPKRENYSDSTFLTLTPYSTGGPYHIDREENGKIVRLSQTVDHSEGWCFYSEGNRAKCRDVRNVQLDQDSIQAIEEALKAVNEVAFHLDRLRYVDRKEKK